MWCLPPLWAGGQGGPQPTLPLGHPNPNCVLTLPLCRRSVLGQAMGSFSLLHFKRHHLHFCARFFTKVLFLLIFVAIIPPQACLTVPLLYPLKSL